MYVIFFTVKVRFIQQVNAKIHRGGGFFIQNDIGTRVFHVSSATVYPDLHYTFTGIPK
jgi:hypothetical protein